ncbi:MAG TPA: thioredoxin-disulfide reductase [Candidatus Thermoplasmatota archaeon]|nr:thioredoxin-disulfide reductase [Candidatus Thermoplasmatota archaeon]
MNHVKLLIIGSGPAGYTAALYAARARLEPLVVAGRENGGQLMLTTDVENYPGFPEGIMGPELMDLFRKQAERFGSTIVDKNVTKVDFSRRPFRVEVEGDAWEADSVILATGASSKWLGLPNETKLRGHGVSSCATCDGAFFKDRELVVVGGGDSAMEEASFLTRFASKVTIVHRRDEFRASKIMQERVLKNPKIKVVWDSAVEDILGDGKVTAVKLRNLKSNKATELKTDGVFVAIGHEPNTKIFQKQVELDEKGYIVLKRHSHTTVEGVFAAGDVHDIRYRQAITAAGAGCRAAMDAEKWLEDQEHPGAKAVPAAPRRT